MWKFYAIIAAIAISFFSGFQASNWHHDSVELAAQKAADKTAHEFQQDQMQIADNVVKSLDQWKQSNVQVQQKIIHEKLQPVFSNVCTTDEYVRLFNQQTDTFSSSGASKPAAKAGN